MKAWSLGRPSFFGFFNGRKTILGAWSKFASQCHVLRRLAKGEGFINFLSFENVLLRR